MKRTTISLPDDLSSALDREARRHRRSRSEIAREALRQHLQVGTGGKRKIPFAAIGAARTAVPRASSKTCSQKSGRTTSRQTRLAVAVVDAGPLYAVAAADNPDHERSLDALQRSDLQLVVPALVVSEATDLIGSGIGSPDRRHFSVVRPAHCDAFELLPA